ncbi:MAG: nicotinate (nicotinamide) nucleotide adenylyltransferase [Candidatus Marinimicrobia bacterium]|nr:nicotinate (nicotinamide) nucleotide adenylyltransferase [Candidatus Neomarinimicrobiota bacterium]MBT5955131.1 nicotinate (nicotinamide) nucleotide adenylyltransferase [Candidatus Neomarinimicrobiota bacterium]MBT6871091.1 nicotinate (nicotinamide) nucleotide adenylyltransferase [Candidatus Neomarinimicrobiota bacterium]|tara:strand:- start:14099 stop:14665 length:567 start_codon:yes stop_codon:yes gene_type:complete
MKIYMFGGSFDPPHLAHIEMVNRLVDDCDKFFIFPAKQSPNKVNETMATSDQRLQMCVYAFGEISPKIEVSNFELNASSPSYTINTVRWILNQSPECDLSVILGEDQGNLLATWYEFEALQKVVSFICFSRNHFTFNPKIRLEYIDDFNYDISSSEFRNELNNNAEKAMALLPSNVFNYILENKLYSC